MNNTQPTFRDSGISITQESELRTASMRSQLRDMFGELRLVRDIITVSVEAMYAQASHFDADVSRVLFRCGAEKLYGQLKSLSDIIEQLGGRTEFSVGREKTQRTSTREGGYVNA